MGKALEQRIKQQKFESPSQEAMLNLMVVSSYLRDRAERECARFDITPQQYNVLRILRGALPAGYPRCDIIDRMIDRAPDVTRLIDRLKQQNLVERVGSEEDRRHSITRITEAGLDLLKRMDSGMRTADQMFSESLSPEECRMLSHLCEKIYGTDEDSEKKPEE